MSILPHIALSMGDPGGIGPEVIVKALADVDLRERARFLVFGIDRSLRESAERAGIKPYWSRSSPHDHDHGTISNSVTLIDYTTNADERFAARPNERSGKLSFTFVEDAVAAAQRHVCDYRRVDGVVTAPICKEAWSLAGFGVYPGHTELFGERFKSERCGMLFHVPAAPGRSMLNVILATIHIPIARVPIELTTHKILDAIELGAETCWRLGTLSPRVAVCGLNPHAGEHGLLGREDDEIIAPAIKEAVRRGLDVRGPFPGDTIFNAAFAGHFDLVVAMYHDQGLIPVKLIARDRAVNVTVGIPCVRTSPDHGTAFDIAGQNKADPGSMTSAIELAVQLCARTV